MAKNPGAEMKAVHKSGAVNPVPATEQITYQLEQLVKKALTDPGAQ
jgi:hypothetical protein